jgi:hypothetical protein
MNRTSFVIVGLLAVVLAGQQSWAAGVLENQRAPIHPILSEMLQFHPSWVTRSVTSHDQWGGNGDGGGNGIAREGDYHVLFHGRGEGRITRIWMTDTYNDGLATSWQELWIQVDGQTVFRGKPLDYFSGKAAWKAPLVLDYQASSGGFLSYVPFSYAHEAKVLLKGEPHYFQVNYREGAGSSSGPTAKQLSAFMTEQWWKGGSIEREPEQTAHLTAGSSMPLAMGPGLVWGVRVNFKKKADLSKLSIRVANQAPVPLPFFFGLASVGDEVLDKGWANVSSSIHHVDQDLFRLETRLPIPLKAGESLTLEVGSGEEDVSFQVAQERGGVVRPSIRMVTQYRDQMAPGTENTMSFFESTGPTQMVALVEEILDTKPGGRLYLEGDEMIRTDKMQYPLQHGTGTEDYYNGGWYFLGAHNNPMAGQPRFIVNDPEDGWIRARYEHSLYRIHVADPIVSRSEMRFGMEAGEMGAYTPVRYRTLGLGYAFDGWKEFARNRLELRDVRSSGVVTEEGVSSALDAERDQKNQTIVSRLTHGISMLVLSCDPHKDLTGVFVTRTYDAKVGGQEARIRINGRPAGLIFEAYANPHRRLAQDGFWVDLLPNDCSSGKLTIELDTAGASVPWSEAGYEAAFFGPTLQYSRAPADATPPVIQGERTRVFDSSTIEGTPYYVNDHSLVQGSNGDWHLYGIYHSEPFGGEEKQFVHARHAGALGFPELTGFAKEGLALESRADLGETHLWAPHVARDGDRYVMVFQSGGWDNHRAQIRIAESTDLFHWQRIGSAPLFEDICVARDPMLHKVGDLWTLYYTRCDSQVSQKSGVAYRTSLDLVNWSEPQMALVLGDTPPMFNSGFTESPFVFERDGWFYLSVTSYPVDWDGTFLYRSRTPFFFPPIPYARLQAHAAEWLVDEQDRLLMTAAGPGQGGVWMMPVSGL